LEQSFQQVNAELKKSNGELQVELGAIQSIGNIIPICAWCGHKIKNANDEWISVEKYIMNHIEAEVSHGMCPGCQEGFISEFKGRGGAADTQVV